MTDVVFPQLSAKDPRAEGVLANWFVDDGAPVTEGQLLGEVMVEKVSGEVVAPASGTVHLAVAPDGLTRQGEVIATIT